MKNLKSGQKLLLIITLLIGLVLLLLFSYKQIYPAAIIQTYQVNSPSLERKLLIATQGSPFKDSVTAAVSKNYKAVPLGVEVIDIKALVNTDVDDFDAILILYRWEARAPPEVVQSFMEKNSKLKNKMVVVTTSWYGFEKTENTDAITGASIVENVPIFTDKIIRRLDLILKSVN